MTILKSRREIEMMKDAGKISAQALGLVGEAVRVGITTGELDAIAKRFIEKSGAVPSFLGYGGYPATICASVNEQVVHGIPGSRVLMSGDIVSIDLGAIYKGYHGDNAKTYAVGQISKDAQRLIDVTEQAFYAGMDAFETGSRLQSISAAVQETAENAGFSVVRELVGHGIGQQLHEEPNVPNFVTGNKGPRLRVGMVLAIEPMINMGGKETYTLSDGWTVCTSDKSMSSHFEHTVALTENGPEILTKG
ncbi:MAG: type I methionyl aminopeptidase [Clostridia bacterium]|jgi:methionyl aminopeptidase|nr:type I methionyl aminopeptidase [Clostridia bacterium]MBT7122369.1 type I methionyl aminopeptidase [Clostridia bacterium]